MANIRIINDYMGLYDAGCAFFLNANEKSVTRFSTAKLRWLSTRVGGEYVSSLQKEADALLSEIANKYDSKDFDKLNLRILLYDNPFSFEDEQKKYVKLLLLCGADIRYLDSKDSFRIAIQGKKMLISFSTTSDIQSRKVSNNAIMYEGEDIDHGVQYCVKYFDSMFEKARKIQLTDNDDYYFLKIFSLRESGDNREKEDKTVHLINKYNIEYTNSSFSKLLSDIKYKISQDWISYIISALVGSIITYIFSLLH